MTTSIGGLDPERALPPAVPVGRDSTAGVAVMAHLRRQTSALLEASSGVGGEDDKPVHATRVATRRLRAGLRTAQTISADIQSMLTGTFRQLNAEYGFSLQAPREPDLARYERDLDLVERSHNQYLGVGNTFRLAQPEFADRLVRALATRLRVVYESALGEVELWNKSAAAQLDAQLRERRRNFGRRLEAIERIQQAAAGLDDRIAEIHAQEAALDQLDAKLIELTGHLVDIPETGGAANEPQLQRA